jgi:hypothetical protein
MCFFFLASMCLCRLCTFIIIIRCFFYSCNGYFCSEMTLHCWLILNDKIKNMYFTCPFTKTL